MAITRLLNNWTAWLLNLNLIYETLWSLSVIRLLISVLEKFNWLRLTNLTTLVLLMWKWIGLFLRKNHLLGCWGWLSVLNWIGTFTLSLLLKLSPRKLEPWFDLWKKWVVGFNSGTTQLVSSDWSSNTGATDVKIGLFLWKNDLLTCWRWLFLLNWIGALTLSLLLKLPPRELQSWFVLWSFFLLRLLCISINLLYGHAWNTVVMSSLCS